MTLIPPVDETMARFVEADSHVISITDMIEGPDQRIYVIGFATPRFKEDVEWGYFDQVVGLIYLIMAKITPVTNHSVEVQVIHDTSSDRSLLLPLSKVLSEINQ